MNDSEIVKAKLKVFKNFPKPNVDFVDIMGIFSDSKTVDTTVNLFVNFLKDKQVDTILGLEARGFLLGPLVANKIGCRFAPIRKSGKLPGECLGQTYSLEYGQDKIEIQHNVCGPIDNVVIIDDLLATGGTMRAAIDLITKTGANIVYSITLIELDHFNGRKQLTAPFHSFLHYD